jgi:hypothetical protein
MKSSANPFWMFDERPSNEFDDGYCDGFRQFLCNLATRGSSDTQAIRITSGHAVP